jgi:effector-binding domain-containing protein
MAAERVPEPELADIDPVATAVVAGIVPMSEIANFFDRSFSTLATVVGGQNLTIVGPAFARYHGPPTDRADLEVGFPVDGAVKADGTVGPGSLPGGRVARLVHHGSYDQLGSAWARLGNWIAERGLSPSDALWEVYVTEPSPEMDPADLRTELYWLLL